MITERDKPFESFGACWLPKGFRGSYRHAIEGDNSTTIIEYQQVIGRLGTVRIRERVRLSRIGESDRSKNPAERSGSSSGAQVDTDDPEAGDEVERIDYVMKLVSLGYFDFFGLGTDVRAVMDAMSLWGETGRMMDSVMSLIGGTRRTDLTPPP